jgi:hypothetical protein
VLLAAGTSDEKIQSAMSGKLNNLDLLHDGILQAGLEGPLDRIRLRCDAAAEKPRKLCLKITKVKRLSGEPPGGSSEDHKTKAKKQAICCAIGNQLKPTHKRMAKNLA